MTSLRTRLLVLLVAMTLLVWATAAVWVGIHTRTEVQRVLDRRLVEAAGMVASLVDDAQGLGARQQSRLIRFGQYNRQLSCQIWSLDGRLLARSSSAPAEPLAGRGTGMTERSIGSDVWRVYTIVDARNGVRVSVGDNLRVRQRLIRDVLTGLILPALGGLIALALLIGLGIDAGLRPLRDLTRRLRQRDPSDFSPLAIAGTTAEIAPLVEAIDLRSQKLAHLRESERQFIANAAHELRTPLAGLKAHAQVARRTTDPQVRSSSLASIEQAVDRSARMVEQLLDLAREEGRQTHSEAEWNDLGVVVGALADEFHVLLGKRKIGISLSSAAHSTTVLANCEELSLALKNLIKNALDHAPTDTRVTVDLVRSGDEAGIAIADDGPGIAPAELTAVRERFVRGSGAAGSGSGLGLSIVDLTVERMGGRLELGNLPTRGLQAIVWLPAGAVRSQQAPQAFQGTGHSRDRQTMAVDTRGAQN
jgi:two-component system sensor histidine kinase QseC